MKRLYRIIWTEIRPFCWLIAVPFAVAIIFVVEPLRSAKEAFMEAFGEVWESFPCGWKREIGLRQRRREILKRQKEVSE